MAAGHIRYKVKTHFLGTRDGELFAVCSWAGDGTCTMIGEARLKLGKWLAYRLDPGAHGVRNPDGSARYHAILERKTGTGTLDAVMDVDVQKNRKQETSHNGNAAASEFRCGSPCWLTKTPGTAGSFR